MRFWSDHSPNRYYKVVCLLSGSSGMPEQKECYGICDEDKGGYIAFATSEEDANTIVRALNKAGYLANQKKPI